jgi:toxin ParE1/3/4
VKPIVLHRLARLELNKQAAWYDRRRSGLGKSFRLRFEAVIREISANPKRYAVTDAKGIRLGQLKRFPFAVVYLEVNHFLLVVAVADQRRKPRYWIKRLRNP